MKIDQTETTELIARHQKQISTLTDLYTHSLSATIIAEMKANGPQLLKDLIGHSENPKVRIEKRYNSSDQEPDWGIFFILELGSESLCFYTQDLTSDYENDGYSEGQVVSDASDMSETISDYEMLEADREITPEEAEETFGYITDFATDLKDDNLDTYYAFMVEDDGQK